MVNDGERGLTMRKWPKSGTMEKIAKDSEWWKKRMKESDRLRKKAIYGESKKASERSPVFASSYERSPKVPHKRRGKYLTSDEVFVYYRLNIFFF